MSEASKYSKQYTAEDIQQYLAGKMSPAEMHALEKAALDDPFLADAIEGMQATVEAYGPTAIDENIGQLKKQLAEKTRQTGTVIPLRAIRWWQVAAAAIILVTGSLLAYNAFFRDKEKDELAIYNNNTSNQPATSKESSTKDSIIPPVIDNKDLSTSEKPSNKDLADSKGKPLSNRDKATEPGFVAPPTVSSSEARKEPNENKLKSDKSIAAETPAGKDIKGVADAELNNADKKAESGKARDDLAKNEEAAVPSTQRITVPGAGNLNYFQGRVTDNNNKPVANATVQLNNQKQAVSTDDNGYFKIPSRDTTVQVLVNSIGFETKEFQLSNRIAYNEIRLDPSNTNLNEVVVKPGNESKSAPSRKNKTNYPKVMVQDAEPIMGWVEFEQYLEKNKKPTTASTKGEVVVSFQVNKQGSLSDYKVEQSLSSSQDAEAIRLIKEGPSWRLKQGRKARVMVIVRF